MDDVVPLVDADTDGDLVLVVECVPDTETDGDLVLVVECVPDADTDVEGVVVLEVEILCVPVELTVDVFEVVVVDDTEAVSEDEADAEGDPVVVLEVETDCVLVGAAEDERVADTLLVPVGVGGGFDCVGDVVVDLEIVAVEVCVLVDESVREVVADFVFDAEFVPDTELVLV